MVFSEYSVLTQEDPLLLHLELLLVSGDILVGVVITEVAEDLIAFRHLQNVGSGKC